MQRPGNEAGNNTTLLTVYQMSKLCQYLKLCPSQGHYVQLCSHLFGYYYAQNKIGQGLTQVLHICPAWKHSIHGWLTVAICTYMVTEDMISSLLLQLH